MIKLLWHVWRKGHSVRVNRHISVPSWDPSAKGWLWVCECGITVAK
jgi:hypothetical protein